MAIRNSKKSSPKIPNENAGYLALNRPVELQIKVMMTIESTKKLSS